MPSSPDDRRDHPGQSLSNDDPSDSSHPHAPHDAPPAIPPETYDHLIRALVSLQASASHAPPQSYPPTYPYAVHPTLPPVYHHPWPPGTTPAIPTPVAGPSWSHSANPLTQPLPHDASQIASSSQLSPPAVSPATTGQAQDSEDAISTSEDKRRRNTAASARFRLKKKLRTLNLERSVTDLTGRTEELEREATDLRRENAWLKEIVLLKGRNLAASNTGSHAPAPENRHGEDAESESESTVGRTDKGKGKGKGKGKSKEGGEES